MHGGAAVAGLGGLPGSWPIVVRRSRMNTGILRSIVVVVVVTCQGEGDLSSDAHPKRKGGPALSTAGTTLRTCRRRQRGSSHASPWHGGAGSYSCCCFRTPPASPPSLLLITPRLHQARRAMPPAPRSQPLTYLETPSCSHQIRMHLRTDRHDERLVRRPEDTGSPAWGPGLLVGGPVSHKALG